MDDGWETDVENKPKENEPDLDSLPESWQGLTKSSKVELLINIVLNNLQKVASGDFNPNKAEKLAACSLMAQMELATFYSDAELDAKHFKHLAEYAEGEKASQIKEEATNQGLKLSEAALTRSSLISSDVKDARKVMVDKEKEYKKWRYMYETLNSAHIFFRNLGKVL